MDEIWEFQNIFQDHFEDSNIYKLFSKETWLDKKNNGTCRPYQYSKK